MLRAPFIGLTENELASIRLVNGKVPFYEALKQYVEQESGAMNSATEQKLQKFFTLHEKWRDFSRHGSLADLIWQVYLDTNYFEMVGAMANGKQRQANLRALHDRALSYEKTSFRGLFRFLRFIDRMHSRGDDLGVAKSIGEADDVVTLYYVINLDETTVSVYYPGVVYGYRDYEVPTGDVVIPETVTHDGTTYRVTTIANYAFYSCEQLTSVTIPASVTLIGEGVFFGCTALRHVSIPESVTNMAPYVFYSCSSLQSVELPQSLTYMGDGMFCSCTSLKEVSVPELIDSIPLRCFYHCDSLRTVLLPEGLTSIDESAFSDCFSLDSMVLPQNITSIGKKAFYNCRNLKIIELPQMLVSMGEESFAFCSKITTLELPAQLSAIGRRAFYCCNGLAEITSLATIPPKAEDDAFYNVIKSIPVNVPLGSAQDYRSAAIWEDFTNITDGSECIS